MVDNWKHSGPKGYYVKCLELFGNPVFVANVKNGSAYWKTKGLFDEQFGLAHLSEMGNCQVSP